MQNLGMKPILGVSSITVKTSKNILRGLAYMHAVAGVCHGDLKPQNEMVDPVNSSGENMRLRKRKSTIVRVEGNISYVCLRFELLLGQPLSPGENSADKSQGFHYHELK